MNLGRALMATLMVASIGAGCGSGDDDAEPADDNSDASATQEPVSSQSASVTEPEPAADADPVAGDVAEFGDNGGIAFTISGGHDESGNFVWVPVASTYAPGWWSMNFTEPSAEGAAVLALSLDPANTTFSYGDGAATIFGTAPQCSFNIDQQDASGASGSFDCAGLTAITGTGMVEDVNITATFDARI